MRAPFVKVCGITQAEDAMAAVRAGARALGFVFVPQSPRAILPMAAADIVRLLPPEIAKVGVVCDLDAAALRDLVREVGLSALQLHGQESPDFCAGLGVPAIKAFAAGPGFQVERLDPYRGVSVLLDGGTQPGLGGTGTPADWGAARRAREQGFRVLLAGGLGPDNILRAIREVEPVAIDLNSGVERSVGKKDPQLIAAVVDRLAGFDPPEASSWPW